MLSQLIGIIQNNEIALGIVMSTILGGLAFALHSIPLKLWRGFLWLFTVQIAVRNYDEAAFDAIQKWAAPLCRHRFVRELVLTSEEYASDESAVGEFRLDIGEGTHVALYKGRLISVTRVVHQERSMLYKQAEEILVRFYFRSRTFAQGTLDAITSAVNKHEGIAVRHWAHEGWTAPIYKQRDHRTVILRGNLMQELLDDVQTFVNAKVSYLARGFPWRRCYLFHGYTGCGKTSAIMALATALKKPICILSLGALSDDLGLIAAVHTAPKDAIIAIEDMGAATFAARDRKVLNDQLRSQRQEGGARGITLSGLLNVIDGIGTPDGRIFIITDNHAEQFDAALVRPGRVDRVVEFEKLDYEAQERYWTLQYGTVPYIPLFRDLSPAVMQEACLAHPNDPEKAYDLLQKSS